MRELLLPVLATLQRVVYHPAAEVLPVYATVAQKKIPQKNLAGFNIAPSVPRALWRLVTSTSPSSSSAPISRAPLPLAVHQGCVGQRNQQSMQHMQMTPDQDWASKRRTPWALETEWRNLS